MWVKLNGFYFIILLLCAALYILHDIGVGYRGAGGRSLRINPGKSEIILALNSSI